MPMRGRAFGIPTSWSEAKHPHYVHRQAFNTSLLVAAVPVKIALPTCSLEQE
ncbi:hypothetical protein L227DRAFT_571353 [Lentinus tigrinus ALCF2SS1-6]|uniref:Uncharacterized protein n=1 Tax=Lentinus tigrinus ALCF2SS1-6 TaxID=1328759 RepID=A0A5C2SNM7_9APHY|nr:hypothetical protein L227DRAFT_571353 [Lentinus tigrinus ALCF2SS1-6]